MQCLTLYEQDMNEEAYHNGSSMDLWIRSDQIWYLELWMRSMNVWDMTECKHCIYYCKTDTGTILVTIHMDNALLSVTAKL